MKEQCYVYSHICPKNNIILYVGYGQKQRARMTGASHRSREHIDWIDELHENGYTMEDIVTIEEKNLSKDEAKKLEQVLIKLHSPKFNDHFTGGKRRLRIVRTEEDMNLSYRKLGEKYGTSTMNAWRACHD